MIALLLLSLLTATTAKITNIDNAAGLAPALNSGSSYDEMVLNPSITYTGTTNNVAGPRLAAVTIRCSDMDAKCRVSGEDTRQVFNLYGDNKANRDEFTAFSGLIVQNGYMNYGAGVYVKKTTLQVSNCIFRDNVSYDDGGGEAPFRASEASAKQS
jgi:hypothetical protein